MGRSNVVRNWRRSIAGITSPDSISLPWEIVMKARLALLSILLTSVGCGRALPPKSILHDLARMQLSERVTIGWLHENSIELILFKDPPGSLLATVSHEQAAQI